MRCEKAQKVAVETTTRATEDYMTADYRLARVTKKKLLRFSPGLFQAFLCTLGFI